MKVALFTETYLPDINGVAAHLKTLKDGLISLGHEVLIVAADKHTKHHYVDNDGVLRCPAIESKRFYGFGVASPISFKRLRIIQEFNPDIIHIHHEFGVGLSGIMASRRTKKPLVYTLHTMYDQYIHYVAPKALLSPATKMSHLYERYITKNAHALTSPSQKGEEYFKTIGAGDKEFFLIPNSADLSAFDPSKVDENEKIAIRHKLGIPLDATIACFVGRMGHEKSVDVLLQFWAATISRDDKLHLMLVGEGPDKEELEDIAVSLGITNMVTFTGRIEHTKMPTYFAMCDAYVTASLSEMNSISMLEGMASGLPTLQRFDELNAGQIQEGVNGYLYHDSAELAKRLKNIANMSLEEKATLKETVRQSVATRGSAELAEYMLTVYESAVEEKFASIQNTI